jgi:hypothetical protein
MTRYVIIPLATSLMQSVCEDDDRYIWSDGEKRKWRNEGKIKKISISELQIWRPHSRHRELEPKQIEWVTDARGLDMYRWR